MTRRALAWWIIPVMVAAGFFLADGARHGFALAFDLLTGTVSVEQSHAGALGWCLLFCGYLILPAAIAVLASAVFSSQVRRLSDKEFAARFDVNYQRVFHQDPPPT